MQPSGCAVVFQPGPVNVTKPPLLTLVRAELVLGLKHRQDGTELQLPLAAVVSSGFIM